MGFKTYRGIALANDPQTPRWSLKSIGATNATLKRVKPRRYGAAIAIGKEPPPVRPLVYARLEKDGIAHL